MITERQPLMSTAGSYGNLDVAKLILPCFENSIVLDRMLKAPGGNGFSPEIMLFSPMMSKENLRYVRSKEEERLGNGETIYWHFPKFHGWYPDKDLIPFAEQLPKIKSDLVGFFILPSISTKYRFTG